MISTPNKKKRAAILGATGMVGRRLAELLVDHPWFEIGLLVGSGVSSGQTYRSVWEEKEQALVDHYGEASWVGRPFDQRLGDIRVGRYADIESSDIDFIFSSVPESAGHAEQELIDRGYMVFSNSPFGRFHDDNPLVVPEVNRHEMEGRRFIKNPNCVTSGLVLILSPVQAEYGLEEVSITTYQSLSGRGDAKYEKGLVIGNIYPLQGSTENTEIYIRKEAKKILRELSPFSVSCSRVGVQEGHYVDVRLKTKRPIGSKEEVLDLFRSYNPLENLEAPMTPEQPIVVITEQGRPRPSHDAFHHEGMAIAVGGISTEDEVYSLRLTYVVNNLIRGAAGGALLNAEVCHAMYGENALNRIRASTR
ncbi:MAG: aspartate-semialdehyde dehydrogenase [Minicystis sp.]